jgi:hypothetical protein
MKLRLFLSAALLVFFSGEAFASKNSCVQFYKTTAFNIHDINTEMPAKISISELVAKDPTLHLSEDFLDAETLTYFKENHPFMTFIAIGERILFLTRRKEAFNSVKEEFSTGDSAFRGDAPSAIKIKEFGGYYAFDISRAKYINPMIRKLAGMAAWDEGPNCWNLCQMYKGWARTAYTTNGPEFGLWVDGPFSTNPKASLFGLEPTVGDVIVLRQRGFKSGKMNEVHGAIALGFGLVFTKNGTSFEAKYQVTTLEEMLKVYLPDYSNTIEYRRIPSLDEVWKKWGGQVSVELKSLVDRWMAFEAAHGELYIPVKGSDPATVIPQEKHEAVDKMKSALKKELETVAPARIASFEGRELSELEKVEQFFWNLLSMRADSSYF